MTRGSMRGTARTATPPVDRNFVKFGGSEILRKADGFSALLDLDEDFAGRSVAKPQSAPDSELNSPGPRPPSKILLYPEDIGSNVHQSSYILFARHSVVGARVKPTLTSELPKVKPVEKQVDGKSVVDDKATALKQSQSNRKARQILEQESNNATGRGGAGAGGSSNSLMLQRRNIKQMGTVIGLYMPPSVNVKYSMDYSEGEIGAMGEALAGLFKEYQDGTFNSDSLAKAGGTVGTGLIKLGIAAIDKAIPGAKDLYAIESGEIMTPRTEMMFRGVGRREFSFTFTFIPKSYSETQTVHKIVKEFKVGMSPTLTSKGSTRTMSIPDVFSVEYMHMAGANNYINKIGKCYLKNMDVTYGGDKFVTYAPDDAGAPPQKTSITLAFQELEIMDRKSVENGY